MTDDREIVEIDVLDATPPTLYGLIVLLADDAIECQRRNGSLPPGQNGPYDDTETPVRNTAHWTITFLKAYDITGDQRYREVAERAIAYLQSEEARPYGVTFHHRETPSKDGCNGLIGQAWTIEALAIAADQLDRPDLAALAKEVFSLHPFDEGLGIWKRVDIDGTGLGFDATFNHQLWFAAAGSVLDRRTDVSGRVATRVRRFLDTLEHNLQTYSSGLVYHPLEPSFSPARYFRLATRDRRGRAVTMIAIRHVPLTDVSVLRQMVRESKLPIRRLPLTSYELHEKAIGYHGFNLYALALLARTYPEHPFWASKTMDRILRYARSDSFIRNIDGNTYGYPYNPPGFEVPFGLAVFDEGATQEQERWLRRQLQRCYDPDERMLSRNTADPVTLTARIYEATRLPNLTIH